MALKPELQKETGDNVIGFPDLISQRKGDASFAPIAMQNGFQAMAGGSSGGGTRNAPEGNVTALFGELQAASELSLDELAKQSELLKDIKQNTDPKLSSAGGQKPPTTEEDIKKKLEGDEEEITEEQGNKIIKLLDEANGTTANLAMFMAALGGSLSALNTTGDELLDGGKGVAKLGVASAMLTGRSAINVGRKLVGKPDPKKVDPKANKQNQNSKNLEQKQNQDNKKKIENKKTTPPKNSVVKEAGKKGLAKQGRNVALRTLGKIALGATNPVIAVGLAASGLYDLGTFGMRALGYGDKVDAFEDGVADFLGIESEEEKAERLDQEKAARTEATDRIITRIQESDLSDEDKQAEIERVQEALKNSNNQATGRGGADKRSKGNRVLKQFKEKYNVEDLVDQTTAPQPQSSKQVEETTQEQQQAMLEQQQPIVNVPEQPAPNVNIPPQPAPNIQVAATLPRTGLPRDLELTTGQARLPKFIVS